MTLKAIETLSTAVTSAKGDRLRVFNIRLEEGLVRRLEMIARREDRSVTAQAARFLRAAIIADEGAISSPNHAKE